MNEQLWNWKYSELLKQYYAKFKQLIIYGAVGLCLNLILYAIYLLIVLLGADPKSSMTLVYLAGVGLGFYSHRAITFSHTGDIGKSVTRYLVAHIIGYLINLACLFIFVDLLGFKHQIIQALSILIVALYLFFIFKLWVFPKSKDHAIS